MNVDERTGNSGIIFLLFKSCHKNVNFLAAAAWTLQKSWAGLLGKILRGRCQRCGFQVIAPIITYDHVRKLILVHSYIKASKGRTDFWLQTFRNWVICGISVNWKLPTRPSPDDYPVCKLACREPKGAKHTRGIELSKIHQFHDYVSHEGKILVFKQRQVLEQELARTSYGEAQLQALPYL